MSKTCMFSSSSSIHHQQQQQRVTIFPRKSAEFLSRKGFPSLKFRPLSIRSSSSPSSTSNSDLGGRRFLVQGPDGLPMNGLTRSASSSYLSSLNAQMTSGLIGKTQKWWEKGIQPNMREIESAQDLVDSLFNAGDKLVIVDFFSPGCGGCKALHPKICQIAEQNPDVQFLQVNYEEHKSMCYSLTVHVLPFFRFYRGAHGRVCSFSCTNATIKKFRDALAKYGSDQCSLGQAKGLEEKELVALAANKDLGFSYTPKKPEEAVPTPAPAPSPAIHSSQSLPLPLPLPSTAASSKDSSSSSLVTSGR